MQFTPQELQNLLYFLDKSQILGVESRDHLALKHKISLMLNPEPEETEEDDIGLEDPKGEEEIIPKGVEEGKEAVAGDPKEEGENKANALGKENG